MPSPSPADATVVTAPVLRDWPLPRPGGDKEDRGRAVVVGGSTRTPGAVLLAAEAALRSGAGKLQVATVRDVAGQMAVAVPEALVEPLPQTPGGAVDPSAADVVCGLASQAAAVLLGPGLTDVDITADLVAKTLAALAGEATDRCTVVLDALALAAVTADPAVLHPFGGRAVLTPNVSELAQTLQRNEAEVEKDQPGAALELASQARAVVLSGGTDSWIASPDGRLWCDRSGGAGLGVSGSGDVLAGVVAGLAARGAEPAQAAVWGAHLHGRAGDRLAGVVGRIGYLARELAAQVPRVLAEVEV